MVEAQLDPELHDQECIRRLTKLARKIEYWQRQAEKAMRAHTRTRRRKLREMGFYVSKLPKCFNLFGSTQISGVNTFRVVDTHYI